MNWIKKGIIFNPKGIIDWADNSALQPTPIVLDNKRIRVFFGFRDKEGSSKIGWVDVDINDPTLILGYSLKPVLDAGLPGAFDDNGVVPSAVVRRDDGSIYLYYAGYQILKKVRFSVLCGLAISHDNGDTFSRVKYTPVMERTDDELLFRVIHSILYEDGKWKAWYGGGSHFIDGGNKTLPVYDIRYIESEDGVNFLGTGKIVVPNGPGEHRVGRPYVIKIDGEYYMFFGASTPPEIYRLTYAVSKDGMQWDRKDDLGLEHNEGDFDFEMSAYPGIIIAGKTYMFYNGNNYGIEGIGLAIRNS